MAGDAEDAGEVPGVFGDGGAGGEGGGGCGGLVCRMVVGKDHLLVGPMVTAVMGAMLLA